MKLTYKNQNKISFWIDLLRSVSTNISCKRFDSGMFSLYAVVLLVTINYSAGLNVREQESFLVAAAPTVVIPQNNPKSESIFSKVPSVRLFTNTFLQKVYSTEILREVFDISQTTAKEFSDYARAYTKVLLAQLGVEAAPALAEFAYRAIAPNFDVLTLPVLATNYANVLANFYFVEGYFNAGNAEDMALAYAAAIAEAARVYMNSHPTSKFQALVDCAFNFILSGERKTKARASLLTFYIGNEWFLASVNYKWISVPAVNGRSTTEGLVKFS